MDNIFTDWVQNELNKRNWSHADLARRSGITQTHISRIMSQMRKPGPDALLNIAKAFQIAPEEVMRRAGLLPSSANALLDEQQLLQELHKKIDRLSAEDRQIILAIVNRMGGINN